MQGIAELGIEVTDHGDGSVRRWRPDRNNRRAMNVAAVVEVIHDTSVRVSELLRLGQLAVVLGGDCTIGIGTVAGCLSVHKHIALLYFDLHPGLNVPGAVESGALDWMGSAHMLGVEGAEELSCGGGAAPSLAPAGDSEGRWRGLTELVSAAALLDDLGHVIATPGRTSFQSSESRMFSAGRSCSLGAPPPPNFWRFLPVPAIKHSGATRAPMRALIPRAEKEIG